ncbi:MAG: DJ-1/PfpI family protein [Clostridia bacterium]|nr:DJ-1/PfpI family protein [Clostridia bacterium]
MVIVLLAEGFEELEALSPVDILRREGIDVKTVGIAGLDVKGAHGITVRADMTADEVDVAKVSAVVFPGGMPGSLNLDASPYADKFIAAATENGGHIAAICAAPLVLGRRGLLRGKNATCFPGFEGELAGANATGEAVVTDGNITTARDFRAAVAFGDELARILK